VKRLLLLLLFLSVPVKASPISGAFTTGTMNSTTTTTQTIVESVISKDYNSGYTYTIAGTGIEMLNSGSIVPSAVNTTGTTDGVSYSWTGLDLSTKPTWKQTENGAAFQLSESYSGPGLSNVTTINRQITTESTQITQSIFQK